MTSKVKLPDSIDSLGPKFSSLLERGRLSEKDLEAIVVEMRLILGRVHPNHPVFTDNKGKPFYDGEDQKLIADATAKAISDIIGRNLPVPQLRQWAKEQSKKLGLLLFKESKKKRNVLMGWYHRNWDVLLPRIYTWAEELKMSEEV